VNNDGLNQLSRYFRRSQSDAGFAVNRKIARNETKVRARDLFDEEIPFMMLFFKKPRENTFILELNFDVVPLLVGGLEGEPIPPPTGGVPPYVPPTQPPTPPPPSQPPTTPPPPPAPPPTPPPPVGGTCTATVGTGGNLQSAVTALSGGGTLCLTGNITISSTVNLKDNIKIDGQGWQVIAMGYYPVFKLSSCDNVTVQNITLLGAHPRPGIYDGCHPSCDSEHAHGIHIEGGSNLVFDNVTMQNNQGDGLYIQSFGTEQAIDIIMQNSTVISNGRMGLAVVSGRNISFLNMTYHNIAYSLVDMEPDWANPSFGVLNDIDNVYVDGGASTGWVGKFWDGSEGTQAFYIGTPYGGISGYNQPSISNITYKNYTVYDARYGVLFRTSSGGGYRISNITFENNVGINTMGHYYAAECDYVDGLIVRNNTQPLSSIGIRYLYTSNCTSVSQSGNTPA
jgi:hypothetical protein